MLNISIGYLGDKESTSGILDSEGWLRTGDVCVIDKDGFLSVVDRLKEIIKYKGYQVVPTITSKLLITTSGYGMDVDSYLCLMQVAPTELEDLLQTHPGIDEAAVVG